MDDDKPIPFPDKQTAPAAPVVEPMTGSEMLREFEDEQMGPDVPRVDGKVERGHGSKFQQMKPHHRARHAALERLVHAEDELVKATAEIARATVKRDEAQTAVEHHAHVASQ